MECASEDVCLRRDKEICYFGWMLLFSWLLMVIYITKEIWFGASLQTPSSSCHSLKPSRPRGKSKNNITASSDVIIELD